MKMMNMVNILLQSDGNEKLSFMVMDWKKEIEHRKQEKEKLHKEIRKLEKQIEKIGTHDYVQYICQEIENKYGYVCKAHRHGGFYLFKKDATKKQIQYGREILKTVFLREVNGRYYFDESVNPLGICNYGLEKLVEMPNTIEGIFNYIMK